MQTARQWMVTHEWMVKPMQQREWIERQGMMLWVAEVFTSLGTGLYLVSIFVNNWLGALIGWLIIMFLKLPLHILYLGKPLRFWRLIPPFTNAWKTSWYPRGVAFTILFTGFAFVQIVTTYLLVNTSLLTGPALSAVAIVDILMKVFAGIFAVLTAMYGGFMMSYLKSVPFWNTGLLPVVFIIAGIADGLALVMIFGLSGGGIVGVSGIGIEGIESASRILLIINALLIATYMLNASYQSTVAQLSVKELIVGRVAVAFWLGIVALGIVIPFVISITSIFVGAAATLLVVAVVSHTLGAFALKYCVLKVGIHRPILPKVAAY